MRIETWQTAPRFASEVVEETRLTSGGSVDAFDGHASNDEDAPGLVAAQMETGSAGVSRPEAVPAMPIRIVAEAADFEVAVSVFDEMDFDPSNQELPTEGRDWAAAKTGPVRISHDMFSQQMEDDGHVITAHRYVVADAVANQMTGLERETGIDEVQSEQDDLEIPAFLRHRPL